MEASQIKDLMEAYASVYTQSEEIVNEESKESVEVGQDPHKMSSEKARQVTAPKGTGVPSKKQGYVPLKDSVDIFDIIKGHLLDEGYADTEEAALVIMANMSEEWRESIIESIDLQERLKPGTKGKISFPTGKQGFEQKMTEKNPKTGRQRATSPEMKALGAHGRARTAQYDAERRGDTEAAKRHKTRRGKIAHVVYDKTNRIIDRADNN